jgi:hypothetical protein
MKYRIKMMSKDELYLTEEEYQKIISSKASGLVFIERLRGSINLNSVETILPENLVSENLKEGRLHDGVRVVKVCGVWKDASNHNIKLDYNYYPELAEDNVISEEEYREKIKSKLLN